MTEIKRLELDRPTSLSVADQQLVSALLTHNTRAEIREREERLGGRFVIVRKIVDTHPIDFSNDSNRRYRFAGVEHLTDPSRPLFPVYVNLRGMGESLNQMVAASLAAHPFVNQVTACIPIPNAGQAFAKEYSDLTGLNLVLPLEKAMHGGREVILPKRNILRSNGEKVVFIDDVLSTGASKTLAYEAARRIGYNPIGVSVLCDRRRASNPQVEHSFFASFHIIEATHFGVQQGLVELEIYEKVCEYFSS